MMCVIDISNSKNNCPKKIDLISMDWMKEVKQGII